MKQYGDVVTYVRQNGETIERVNALVLQSTQEGEDERLLLAFADPARRAPLIHEVGKTVVYAHDVRRLAAPRLSGWEDVSVVPAPCGHGGTMTEGTAAPEPGVATLDGVPAPDDASLGGDENQPATDGQDNQAPGDQAPGTTE